MELKEFIKSSVQALIDATSELGAANIESGNLVNPKAEGVSRSDDTVRHKDGFTIVTPITFDIAVTEEEGASKSGGGGIRIAPFQAGGQAGATSNNATVSRIQFTLRVALKTHGKSENHDTFAL